MLNGEVVKEERTGFCKWEDFELKDCEVVIYVKNFEFFDKFNYTGATDWYGENGAFPVKYFIFKPTFADIKDSKVWFMKRSNDGLFNPNCDMHINFDY